MNTGPYFQSSRASLHTITTISTPFAPLLCLGQPQDRFSNSKQTTISFTNIRIDSPLHTSKFATPAPTIPIFYSHYTLQIPPYIPPRPRSATPPTSLARNRMIRIKHALRIIPSLQRLQPLQPPLLAAIHRTQALVPLRIVHVHRRAIEPASRMKHRRRRAQPGIRRLVQRRIRVPREQHPTAISTSHEYRSRRGGTRGASPHDADTPCLLQERPARLGRRTTPIGPCSRWRWGCS